MEHFCNAFNAEAAFHAKVYVVHIINYTVLILATLNLIYQSHEEITKRIPDLLASASDPNELPEESAVLLEVHICSTFNNTVHNYQYSVHMIYSLYFSVGSYVTKSTTESH